MPSKADRTAGRTAEWDPKYPEAAGTPEQGVYEEPLHGGAQYTPAPATSHVYGWRVQSGGFLKFYAPSIGAPEGTKALLGVAFKPSPPPGSTVHPNEIKSEYVYAFQSVDEANAVAAAMAGDQHPGEVVDRQLIKPRVWYKKLTKVR